MDNPGVKLEKRVKFETVKEEWSEYTLENGTILKVKPIVVDVIKTNKKDPYGFPVYIIKTTTVTAVYSPLPQKEENNGK